MAEITEPIAKVIARMHVDPGIYVPEWKLHIPPWSQWEPGMPGDPEHRACNGTGYYRVDLPLGHPQFGDLHRCECAERMQQRKRQAH